MVRATCVAINLTTVVHSEIAGSLTLLPEIIAADLQLPIPSGSQGPPLTLLARDTGSRHYNLAVDLKFDVRRMRSTEISKWTRFFSTFVAVF